MKKASNKQVMVMVIPLVNFCSFLLSTALLVGGVWVATHSTTSTFLLFLQLPLLAISGATLLILLSAILFRTTFLIYLYTCAASFLLPSLLALFLFLFLFALSTAATDDHASGRPVLNQAYKEYYLHDYSAWMADPVHWTNTSAACRSLGNAVSHTTPRALDLTPIQSGCCKPPTECGYTTYVNETVWKRAEGGVATANPDCSLWSNDQEKLCYGCSSCKAGVIATRRRCFMGMLPIATLLLIMLALTYVVADLGLNRINQMELYNADIYGA